MPEETGTATARSGAPSADDSPFADVVEDTAVAVTEAEDSNGEVAQEPQGSDNGDEQAAPPEELKVVVSIKGDRATIEVQQPQSDPHIESFHAHGLSGLAQEIPAVTERAKARWEDEPRYPAHVKPAPPARRQARRGQAAAQASPGEGRADRQQPETMRMF